MRKADDMQKYCNKNKYGQGLLESQDYKHFQLLEVNLESDEEALICFMGTVTHSVFGSDSCDTFACAVTNKRFIMTHQRINEKIFKALAFTAGLENGIRTAHKVANQLAEERSSWNGCYQIGLKDIKEVTVKRGILTKMLYITGCPNKGEFRIAVNTSAKQLNQLKDEIWHIVSNYPENNGATKPMNEKRIQTEPQDKNLYNMLGKSRH